jgi:hypothetical protein
MVWQSIRRLNDQILQHEPWRVAEYDQRIALLNERWKKQQIALDREYFFALHLRPTLEELVRNVRSALGAAP